MMEFRRAFSVALYAFAIKSGQRNLVDEFADYLNTSTDMLKQAYVKHGVQDEFSMIGSLARMLAFDDPNFLPDVQSQSFQSQPWERHIGEVVKWMATRMPGRTQWKFMRSSPLVEPEEATEKARAELRFRSLPFFEEATITSEPITNNRSSLCLNGKDLGYLVSNLKMSRIAIQKLNLSNLGYHIKQRVLNAGGRKDGGCILDLTQLVSSNRN